MKWIKRKYSNLHKNASPIFRRRARKYNQKRFQWGFPPRNWTNWEHAENAPLQCDHAHWIEVSNLIIVGYLRFALDTVASILTFQHLCHLQESKVQCTLPCMKGHCHCTDCNMPNAYRGAGITIAGPLPSLLDRRSNVLSRHVTPLCNSRSSAATALP